MKTRNILILLLLLVCGSVNAQMQMNLTMKNGEKVQYNVNDIASVEWGEATTDPEPTKTIEVRIVDLKYNSAVVDYIPSDKNAHFAVMCVEEDWASQFETLHELAEDDLLYYQYMYGDYYDYFGYSSYEELFFDNFASIGDYQIEVPGLEPEKTYVAYAYYLDDDLNIISDVYATYFTTPAIEVGECIGQAIWHDVFVTDWYSGPRSKTTDLPCDVYEDPSNPGVFAFHSPYSCAIVAEWMSVTEEEMLAYEGTFWNDVMIIIDASDPEKVKFDVQNLGVSLNSGHGFVLAGSQSQGVVQGYGTYADGQIVFPASSLSSGFTLFDSGTLYQLQGTNPFVITMPQSTRAKVKAPAKRNPRPLRAIKSKNLPEPLSDCNRK